MNRVIGDQRLLQLLKDLVRIPSPTGSEGRIGGFLEGVLQEMGFTVTRQELRADRFNLLATTQADPKVLLCTHMDTVLPQLPYSETENLIRGRGACDAKGAMAAMISAAESILAERHAGIGLLFVVGEEKDSDGARRAAELELNSEYVVLGEPTGNRAAKAQKGTLVFRLEVLGKAAHSACPQKGRSAIHELIKLVGDWIAADWGGDPIIGPNTLNIGQINGGVGANVVAAGAWADGIFRLGTGSAEVNERLLSYAGKNVLIRILSSSEPVELYVPPGVDSTIVSFGSDAPYLQPLGKVVMLGPGSIEHAHGPDEMITVDELVSARNQYISLIEKLSSQSPC